MNRHESLGAVHTGKLKEKIKITLIIITILLIILLCFNAGVYAVYVLSATDVSYTKPGSTSTTSVKSALDELYTTYPLAKAVSVGDYVAYDAGNNHSYTSQTGTGSSHGNGSGNQIFTSSSSVKWRVLGWDDETGGVMLISESPIGNFALKGAIGYLYAEQELNEICKIYGYGTGANTNKKFSYVTGDAVEGTKVGTITGSSARSINVDDVNRICGVIPSVKLKKNYGKAQYTKEIYYPTTSQSLGYSLTSVSRTDVYTDYNYVALNYLSNTSAIYKILFKNISNLNDIEYWLSSRSVFSDAYLSSFAIRFIEKGEVSSTDAGGVGYNDKYYCDKISSFGLRPIVFLKSTLQTNGKNSNGAWNIIDK